MALICKRNVGNCVDTLNKNGTASNGTTYAKLTRNFKTMSAALVINK